MEFLDRSDTPAPWSTDMALMMTMMEPMGNALLNGLSKTKKTDWSEIHGIIRMIDIEKFTRDLNIFLKTFVPEDKMVREDQLERVVKALRLCVIELMMELREETPSMRRLWTRCKIHYDNLRPQEEVDTSSPSREEAVVEQDYTRTCNHECPFHC